MTTPLIKEYENWSERAGVTLREKLVKGINQKF